eukprot:Gb_36924 [translate_table: standard]
MDSREALSASKSHFWILQLSFLCFLLLAVCSSSAKTLSQKKFHTIDVEEFRLKNGQDVSKCKAQQLENSNTEQGQKLKGGVQIGLSHTHGACSPLRPLNSSWLDMVRERLERDESHVNAIKFRIAASNSADINSAGANLPLQSGRKYDTGNYIVTAGFGTPAKKFLLTIDTGSDVTWMQCQPCSDQDACYSQVDPIFNPKQSSSYKRLGCLSSQCLALTGATGSLFPCSTSGCVYEVRYGDGSTSEGDFSQETLTLASDSFPNFAFGCGHTNTGLFKASAGLLGLGRNQLSFPSQSASKYGGQFSYCLPDFSSAQGSGSLSLGQGSIPSSASFTPLLSNPAASSFYFLGLTDISVGGERLFLSPGLFQPTSGGGGTIIDSGTVITRLTQTAYDALKAAFRKKTAHLPSADRFSILDTCYNLAGYNRVQIPTITFHFQGNANVDVNGIGILVSVSDDGSHVCLAFASASDDLSIIGNFQQQRFRIAYDTRTKRIGFAPQSCSH